MDKLKILNLVDHSNLSQTATFSDIKKLLDEGIKFNVASCCIPPKFVKESVDYVEGKLPICTVIGFPNGYNTTRIKVLETICAIEDGASEIDMVISLGDLKAKNFSEIALEIGEIRSVLQNKILKVIIETCLLTEDEKIKMCEIVTERKADFIKTSTGFSNFGARIEDVELFKKHIGKDIKIKVAGGISSFEDAEKFILAGADRIGASKLIKGGMIL